MDGGMSDKKYLDIYGEEDESEFLRLARKRFEDGVDYDQENRSAAEEDLAFKAGEQWDQATIDERTKATNPRPCLTINRMPQFVRQVTGDIRINRPSVRVRPVDDKSDPAVANIYTGLIRDIEQKSKARVAYNTAADNSASCGIGHFRIVTEYVTDDVFEQDIRIKRMPNAMSVVWDPHSVEITREDARYCFVFDWMPKAAFEQAYPDANMSSFDAMEGTEGINDWFNDESVRVAEYWIKVPTKKTLCLLANGEVVEKTDGYAALDIAKEREVMVPKVYQYIISGAEILEGPKAWAGKHIPIIPVIGEEIFVGDRCVRHGVVRFAKDPQKLYNYARSASAETISLAPKAPFIGTVAMFKGKENDWAKANTENLAYLAYNPDPKAPTLRPERQLPPQLSTAIVAEVQTSADEMKAVTGIYDAALGNKSNETSGRAIRARQMEGDVGAYVYMDNLSIAIGYCGEILVDLIPRIYDTERVVRLLNEDDTEEMALINKAVIDTSTGEQVIQNNLAIGRYDVVVNTGPSYSTKRMEASESMMNFVQAFPAAAPLIGDLIAKNQDWPGADKIADRLKKLLPPGVDEEAPPPAPPPPDPKMIEAEAKAQKTQADTEKAQAEAEGQRLENMLTEMQLAQMTGAITDQVTAAVTQAVSQIMGLQPPPQVLPQQAPGQEPGFLMPNQSGSAMA